ncbi:hypothetical protein, partial [Alcaligenes faecalis]|uniref:hypothetical protein n=1 Tax=Alcaligenes faecalis TaxID=511 RepID=UPI0029334DC7
GIRRAKKSRALGLIEQMVYWLCVRWIFSILRLFSTFPSSRKKTFRVRPSFVRLRVAAFIEHDGACFTRDVLVAVASGRL